MRQAATVFGIFLLMLGTSAAQAATCSYTNFNIGIEVVAVDGPNASAQYRYVASTVRCSPSGQVIFDSGTGFSDAYDMGWMLPATLVASVKSTFGIGNAQARIFVSGCNTHLLTVNKYWPAGQSIAGISMAGYPVSNTPYVGVFQSSLYLKLGPNFSLAQDLATGACTLRPDSGLNSGMCVAGADNGFGSTAANGTNPINPAWRGNKTQRETDYAETGDFPLHLVRTYNSRAARVAGLTGGFDSAVAGAWSHNYQRSLQLFAAADTSGNNAVQSAALFRPDGKILVFNPSGGNWVAAAAHVGDTLTRLGDGSWRLITTADDTESYSSAGRLTSITSRSGLTQALSYDANGRVSQVTDAFGRALIFTYNASGRMATLTDPKGGLYQYAYDSQGNLTSVTYPGGGIRNYLYENPAYLKALTGITDENAERTATYAYDSQGRAISSEHGGSGSSIDLHTVAYNANGSATISDALGAARTFSYLDQFSTAKLVGSTQPGGSGCGPAAQAVSYDTNGFVATRTDFNGVQTTYTRNSRGLETSRVEASGTALARTISTQWHSYWRLPLKIAEPKKLITYTYNGDGGVFCAPTNALIGTQPIGVVCSQTEQATTDATGSQGLTPTVTGSPRIWSYTYDQYGQVLTANGPRTDVADVTTYTYYAANDADLGKRGNPATITNALGHVTQITAYDPNGRPLTIIDPNNVTLTFTYTPRGWLHTSSISGQTTTYAYDGVGQLTNLTRPDGSQLSYDYDPAHRLTAIGDGAGNRVEFTLDALGNITRTDWLNPDTSPAKTHRASYDALGRLQAAIDTRNAIDYSTTHGYDPNGNPTTITDPKTQTTSTQYDALNRPTRITDALAGLTTLAYDARGQLTQFNAPNNAQTNFTVDGLSNITLEASADRGNLTATHDAAGNLLTLADARSISSMYLGVGIVAGASMTFSPRAATGPQLVSGKPDGFGIRTSLTAPIPRTAMAFGTSAYFGQNGSSYSPANAQLGGGLSGTATAGYQFNF